MKKITFSLVIFAILSGNLWARSVFPRIEITEQISGTATSSSVMALDDNIFRCLLVLVNQGVRDIYVKFSSSHSALEGIKVSAGGSLTMQPPPKNSVYVKTQTSTSAYSLLEGECLK